VSSLRLSLPAAVALPMRSNGRTGRRNARTDEQLADAGDGAAARNRLGSASRPRSKKSSNHFIIVSLQTGRHQVR